MRCLYIILTQDLEFNHAGMYQLVIPTCIPNGLIAQSARYRPRRRSVEWWRGDDVMSCEAIWCNVCDVCDVMWCSVMQCDTVWCSVMWCDVFLSDVMWLLPTNCCLLPIAYCLLSICYLLQIAADWLLTDWLMTDGWLTDDWLMIDWWLLLTAADCWLLFYNTGTLLCAQFVACWMWGPYSASGAATATPWVWLTRQVRRC